METKLRKLARSNYWQILYARAHDIGSLKLFNDDGEYSNLQIEFLHWLQVYHYLYSELNDDDLLIESYINCDVSIDAYLYYRRTHKKKDAEIEKSSPNSFSLIQKHRN